MRRDGRPLIVSSGRLPEHRFPLPGPRVQRSPSNPALGVLPRAFNHARDAPGIAQARGFTLLEILLALVLLAFAMAGVWGAITGATRITHSADALMAQSERVRTVQQFLRRYVGAAGPQPWVTGSGAPARMFRGDSDSMQYVAPLPTQSGHAGLYLQTVSLEKNASGQMSLWLAYQPYTGNAPPDAKPVTHLLLANIRGGGFEYLAAAAFGQPGGWRDDWRAPNGLPLAVRIHVDPAWRTRVAFPDLVIPLHAGDGFGARAGGVR